MKIEIPAVALEKNLMWTRSGVVWATWRIQPPLVNGKPVLYGLAPTVVKGMVLGHHQELYQAMRGEALMLGLCADVDPTEIVDRMLEGIDVGECSEWADEVERTYDALEQIPLGERAYWLAIPLAMRSPKEQLIRMGQVGDRYLREQVGLPAWRPSPSDVRSALVAAASVAERIPANFKPTPATGAEQMWIALHLQQRGLGADGMFPLPAPSVDADTIPAIDGAEAVRYPRPTSMPHPWLDEGGQSDVEKGQRFVPYKRRYLKVVCPWSTEEMPSYQVTQALVAGPRDGWQSPGVEWISFADQMPFDVDWALRLCVTPAADVRRRNKRAENDIKDQFEQQDGTNEITGGTSELGRIATTLKEYHAALNASDKEVEVEATVMFTTSGHTAEIAKTKARILRDEYKRHEFILEAPLGAQEELWWASWPGVPTTPKVREHAQITTGAEFATGVPVVGFSLGDSSGARFATNISGGRRTPVLIDRASMLRADLSASFGTVAELGAGKSVLMKCDMGNTVDRGGRVIAIDRTEAREYAVFAETLSPDQTQIVDLVGPTLSLDPLRVLGPRRGARMVQSLFATMLGVSVIDPRGVALSRLLKAEYLAANEITSLLKLAEHISGLDTPEARELSGLIETVSMSELGEVLFNDKLAPLDITARAIVFLTRGLTLPTQSELEHEHLFKQMTPEKIVGRAMYAMLMNLSRTIAFEDKNTLVGVYIDEVYFVTSSPEGLEALRLMIQDGRKHGAFVGIASHDPVHFGDTVMRGLIPEKYVMRQRNKALARRAVQWLTGAESTEPGTEAEPADEYLVEIVTHDLAPVGADGEVAPERRGEGLMSDRLSTIGKIQKTLPENPRRRAAVLSTPLMRKEAA